MHFEETTDVKLAMLFNEVLVLRGRPSEAEALVGQVVEASRAINGAIHVVTMCAVEGQAAVLRALAKHREAVALLEPVVQVPPPPVLPSQITR